MKSEGTGFVIGLVCGCILMGIITLSISSALIREIKEQAVSRGHAEYKVLLHGKTKWQWKDAAVKEKE